MERPSKSQRKRDALSAQDLGKKLVMLPEDRLRQVPLPEDLLQAINLARKITKHGGRKRQLQYIGALMRRIDIAPISEAVHILEEGDRRQVELHQQAETWRDELISGNEELLRELSERLPDGEQEQLRELAANARNERLKKAPSPTPSRVLFRCLFKLHRS